MLCVCSTNSLDAVCLKHVDVFDLGGCQEQQRVALGADARRATDAVDVVTWTARRVVLHDPAHVRQIQAPRRHVLQ